MVNTGKPSKGCYLCRARRIKCDEGKPSCMRCHKSKRECPGYRDEFELKLRDQTKATKRKSSTSFDTTVPTFTVDSHSYQFGQSRNDRPTKRRMNTSDNGIIYRTSDSINDTTTNLFYISSYADYGSAEPTMPISPVSEIENELPWSPKTVIPREFSPPIDQQATCFFLSNFVLLPRGHTAKGNLDFLIPLVYGSSRETSLVLALNAVALVAFANQPNARKLLPLADRQYVTALNQINNDLQDVHKAKEDATLAAVFLLSFYEQISSHSMSISGWESHINGAVALVKARGKSQLDTKIGRSLFDAVRTHMTIECISRSKDVEEGIDWWTSFASEDKVQHDVSVLNLKVADLRAETHRICALEGHTTENIEKVLNHMKKAERIEKEYVDWYSNLPEEWTPKVAAWVDDTVEKDLEFTACYPGRVDVYGELWMATTHNIVRASRLFILTTILRCTAWITADLDYKLTPEYVKVSRQASVLIEDIVSSIPFFFGWKAPDAEFPLSDNSYFPCGNDSKISGKGVTGVWAIWPVFAAAASDFATSSQRLWLRGRLKYIAEHLGIRQAEVLLQLPTRYPSTFIYRDKIKIEDLKRTKMASMVGGNYSSMCGTPAMSS
ncbi:uncharacterized protein EAE98_010693 [Botrytis deweyae]|uniref:Zn(2)-C6 fungal-type domain-containing protein n=1 Tax=Botrytis deweyae TaxID=2478750 RepID=A0ABQ7I7X5_9HELO|nr:uncharacterized protein EAE98_010693 [Botrytis deweyae]KAF7916393.1 hypothetical protein EAE98_010693 [Botrytis deweyae]